MHNLDPLNETAFEVYDELSGDALSEADELELASELMEVTSDGELDQFLGKLIKRAARGLGTAVHAATGNSLGGVLKGLARKALPFVTQAIGSAVGGPAGGFLAGRLNDVAGRAFGLELEGMSEEDQELEVSRRFVRLASDAARRALSSGSVRGVRPAVVAALRRHAPGLSLTGMSGAPVHVHHHHCTCASGGASPQAANADPEPVADAPASEFEDPEYEDVSSFQDGAEFEEPEYEARGLEEPEFEFDGELGQSGRWFRRGSRIILVGA